jgi:hypothetical protein
LQAPAIDAVLRRHSGGNRVAGEAIFARFLGKTRAIGWRKNSNTS